MFPCIDASENNSLPDFNNPNTIKYIYNLFQNKHIVYFLKKNFLILNKFCLLLCVMLLHKNALFGY